MASQYTKDITKSKVYKQATGQDTKFIDEAIDVLGVVKKFGQSNIADNIARLQEEKVFDAQNKKNQLMQLNKFSELETDLQDNYGGDIEAFSKAKAKELLDQRALLNLPVADTEKQKLTVSYPDEAYGPTLTDASNAYKKNFMSLRERLNEAGIPYTEDAAKQGAFIDEAYQNIFNNVSRANNFNVMKGMGSLFRGQGLNYTSAADLKKSYNENISKSKLSEIDSLNKDLKAIYTFSPELTDKIAKTLKNADIRKDVTTKIGTRQKETITDSVTGQQRIVNYIINSVSWTDLDGKPQYEEIRTNLPDDPYQQKLAPIAEQALYASLLENVTGAEEEYYRLINDENYLPEYAYKALDGKFKKSFSQVDADSFRRENFAKIEEAYNLYRDDNFFTTDALGNKSQKADLTAYLANPTQAPKPSYYKTLDEYVNQFVPVETRVNKSNVIGGDIAILDYNLANNSDWREYADSFEGKKDLREFKDAVISNETFLEELKTEFENGDRSRVDSLGNYFPRGNDAPAFGPAQLEQMGLGSILQGNQALGYNVVEDQVVIKSYQPMMVEEPGVEVEEEPTTIGDTAKAVFDFAKDFVIGEELSLDDALWLVPGAGIAVNLGRRVITKGFTTIAPRILKSKDTQKAISELNKIQNKTIQVRKTTKRKAKSGPNKGEMIEVPVKGQGPKNFKTVPSGNPQYFNFRTKGQFDTWFEGLDPLKKALVKSMKTVDNKGVVSYSKNVDIKSFSKELGNIKGSKVQLKMPGGGLTYTVGTGGAVVKSGAEFGTMEDEE